MQCLVLGTNGARMIGSFDSKVAFAGESFTRRVIARLPRHLSKVLISFGPKGQTCWKPQAAKPLTAAAPAMFGAYRVKA